MEKKTKTIMIISTGGTISGAGVQGSTTNYQSGQVQTQSILKLFPQMSQQANFETMSPFDIASDDITDNDLITLSSILSSLIADDRYDAFIITHGTDTLEETAYFLNLTVKTSKPIIVTGAMRPSTAISPDGPQNLYQSIQVALSSDSCSKGVLVVFGDTILGAREVTKISAHGIAAFGSRTLGVLGYIQENEVEFIVETKKCHTYNSGFSITKNTILPKVGIIYFHINAEQELLDYMLNKFDGLVIAGAGNGAVSTDWETCLSKKEYKNKRIIITSRVANGKVVKYSSIPDQCISAGTLSSQKARILLQLALLKTNNISEIHDIFQMY